MASTADLSSRSTSMPEFTATELRQAINLVLTENQRVLETVECGAVAHLTNAVLQAKRVFAAGEGRSGLALQMAAMRLMHLGLEVHIVGEVSAPAIQPGDLLIACSGSGNTGGVVAIAQSAKKVGAQVAVVTTQRDSSLGALTELIIQISAATKQDYSHQQSQQFAGSLFEQATLLLFDALFHVLSHRLGKTDDVLMARHTNLE